MGEQSATEATASAIISFAEKLEDISSRFCRNLSERCIEDKEMFLAFAKEDEKNKLMVTRTYRETITDAIEACFSFKDLNLGDYKVETTSAQDASYSDALRMALDLEGKPANSIWMWLNARDHCLPRYRGPSEK